MPAYRKKNSFKNNTSPLSGPTFSSSLAFTKNNYFVELHCLEMKILDPSCKQFQLSKHADLRYTVPRYSSLCKIAVPENFSIFVYVCNIILAMVVSFFQLIVNLFFIRALHP